MADLSERLLNAPADRLPQHFSQVLERVTRVLGVDRCTLGEFTDDGRALASTHGFSMPGIPPATSADLTTALPWYAEQVRRGQTLVLDRLPESLPYEARAEVEFVAAMGLKSHLTVPLKAAGAVLGYVAVGTFRSFREWSAEAVSSMEVVAGLLAGALARQQAARRLHAVEDLNRSLREEVRELRDKLDAETVMLQKEDPRVEGFEEIVGGSAPLAKVLRQIDQVGAADSPVLVLGETGTGKELVARAIHQRSRRKNRPLVTVNCAALPDALIESEMFGYEKGAFTGAVARTVGRFEVADGGSILLDEVGELPLGAQAKLLRVLEGGTFERLGSSRTIKVNVRVIASTNRDLTNEVREGRFRADLFYRLNVFPITLPPLRERMEDIPLLVWHFIEAREGALGRKIKRVPDPLMRALETYTWPGNVRELENVIERALIVTNGPVLMVDVPLPDVVDGKVGGATRLDDVERSHIKAVLAQCGWKVSGKGNAADRLGLKRGTLQFRMKKLGIRRPENGV